MARMNTTRADALRIIEGSSLGPTVTLATGGIKKKRTGLTTMLTAGGFTGMLPTASS